MIIFFFKIVRYIYKYVDVIQSISLGEIGVLLRKTTRKTKKETIFKVFQSKYSKHRHHHCRCLQHLSHRISNYELSEQLIERQTCQSKITNENIRIRTSSNQRTGCPRATPPP